MKNQLEEITQKLFLLKKRIREPEMNELFEKHNRSVIEVINRTFNNHITIPNDVQNSSAYINNLHLLTAQKEEIVRNNPNKTITTNAIRNPDAVQLASHCLNNESTCDSLVQNSSIRISKKSKETKSKKNKRSPPKVTFGAQKVVNLPPEDNLINIAFGKNGGVPQKIASRPMVSVKKKEEEVKKNPEQIITGTTKEKPLAVDIPKPIMKEEPFQPVQVVKDKDDHFFDQKEDIFETDLDREIIYPTPPFEDDDMKNESQVSQTTQEALVLVKPREIQVQIEPIPLPLPPIALPIQIPTVVEQIKPEIKEQSPPTQVTVLNTKITIPNTFITDTPALICRKNTNEKKVSKIVDDDEEEEGRLTINQPQIKNDEQTARVNENNDMTLNESVSMIGNKIKIHIDFKELPSPLISEKCKNDIGKANATAISANSIKSSDVKSDKRSAKIISASLNLIEIDRKRLSLIKPNQKPGNKIKEKKEITNVVSKKIISSIKEIANRPNKVIGDKNEKKSENPMVKLLENSGEIKKKDFSSFFIFSLKEETSNIYKKVIEHLQSKSTDNKSHEPISKLQQFEAEWESIDATCNQINDELSKKEFKFQTICEKSLKISFKLLSIMSHPDIEKLYEVLISMILIMLDNILEFILKSSEHTASIDAIKLVIEFISCLLRIKSYKPCRLERFIEDSAKEEKTKAGVLNLIKFARCYNSFNSNVEKVMKLVQSIEESQIKKKKGKEKSANLHKIINQIKKYIDINPYILKYSKCLKLGKHLCELVINYITDD